MTNDPTDAPWRVVFTRDPREVRLIVKGGDAELTVEDIDRLSIALGAARDILEPPTETVLHCPCGRHTMKVPAGDPRAAVAGTVHPDVADALRGFEVEHLPPDLIGIAREFRTLALTMAEELPGDVEAVRGLHKLVEAKDCAVRALVFNRPAT